jgi:hypothetical protein
MRTADLAVMRRSWVLGENDEAFPSQGRMNGAPVGMTESGAVLGEFAYHVAVLSVG